jgi:hypothetical protein
MLYQEMAVKNEFFLHSTNVHDPHSCSHVQICLHNALCTSAEEIYRTHSKSEKFVHVMHAAIRIMIVA